MTDRYDEIVKKELVSEEEIAENTKRLGKIISTDYAGKELVLVGMLKGAMPFMMDLAKNITLPLEMDFIQTSSYHGGTSSSTAVMFKKDIDTNVLDKHVLLVDDVVDTAKTITKVLEIFKGRGAASIELCCLLDKPEGRVVPYEAKYVGKVIPNEFVIGYGLDYNEHYRNLPYVGVVKDEVYK
jgi:hypoxanthine phosphoribosyltransferase